MEYNYTFGLDYEMANRIVAFTKTFGNDGYREGIARCKKVGRVLTVSSVNNYALGTLRFAADEFASIPEGEEFYIMVPKKKFTKKDVYVTVEATENRTTYTTALGATSLMFEEVKHYVNTDKIIENQPDTQFKIAFNPKLLAKALEAFDTDYVEMEFSNDTSGVYIKSRYSDEMAFVLPKKLYK